MKYCKPCRLLATEKETNCRRCGNKIVELRATSSSEGDSDAAYTIDGKIAELAASERRNVRNARFLLAICAAIVAGILVTAFKVYEHSVLAYAVLKDVEIEQDEFEANRVRVSFDVVRPGIVAFDRALGIGRTEKIDTFAEAGPVSLSWAWPSPEDIDFNVRFRSGLFKSSESRIFDVDDSARSVDVVFLIDKTQSMRPFINALKRKCTEFADVVRREGHDVQLGFVSFGDVDLNESIDVFEPSSDVKDFKSRVGKLKVTGGGDEPESSVEALQRALKIPFRDKARPCFIHVTDASCHHEERLPKLAVDLKRGSVITYVVSLEENANMYARLCSNGGSFLSMEDADFDSILDYVARALVSEIRYQG